MIAQRVAVVAGTEDAALHGLDGSFEWGEARTFSPADAAALAAWAPATVFALGVRPPAGAWRTIVWPGGDDPRPAAPGDRAGGDHARLVAADGRGLWRRAPRPAADSLAVLHSRRGSGVVVAGGDEAVRVSALGKLRARRVEAWGAPALTLADLERAAVVALLGEPGAPLPHAAPAVLAAGRILVAPRAAPGFGLMPWSDHLPYDNEDELACSADVAQSFPEAFEPIVAMGILAAEAHLASAVYARLAVDAELDDARSASASA